MPHFTTLAAFCAQTGDDAPTPAELALIAACQAGVDCVFGDGIRPTAPSPARNIRANLLRLLITGASPDCGLSDDGVELKGAWITGELQLAFAKARGRTVLVACHFTEQPEFTQARLQLLSLLGSMLPGLSAQGMMVNSSVFLRNLVATDTVDVNTAKIGGHLSCQRAKLDGNGGKALFAQGVTIGGSLLLNSLTANGADPIHFTTNGTVDVSNARITGQMSCQGATLDGSGSKALFAQGVTFGGSLILRNLTAKGTVDMTGARIGGQMDCSGSTFASMDGAALVAQGMRVIRGLAWVRVTIKQGRADLNSAHVSDLFDDMASWPSGKDQLVLLGFTYDSISGNAATDAESRLAWLAKGAVFDGRFYPQPYSQLAKVLSDMGHDADARRVLLERETLLSRDQWKTDQIRYHKLRDGSAVQRGDMGWQWLRMWSSRIWSSLIRRIAGYGHAPERALYWTAGFLLFGTMFYFIMWQFGAMVPNSAIILTSADWAAAMALNPTTPAQDWIKLPTAAHYETFYALPYAADVFVPLVDLGQQSAWSQTTASWSGWVARIVTWVIQIAGWIVSALGAAAITGIVQRDRG